MTLDYRWKWTRIRGITGKRQVAISSHRLQYNWHQNSVPSVKFDYYVTRPSFVASTSRLWRKSAGPVLCSDACII